MSRIVPEVGIPAACARAYQVSPRAWRACRILAGMPDGTGPRVLSGFGGKSRSAPARIFVCRSRSSSVSRRFTCFSRLLLIDFLSRFGNFVSGYRDHGIVIDLFVDDNDEASVGRAAEDRRC